MVHRFELIKVLIFKTHELLLMTRYPIQFIWQKEASSSKL